MNTEEEEEAAKNETESLLSMCYLCFPATKHAVDEFSFHLRRNHSAEIATDFTPKETLLLPNKLLLSFLRYIRSEQGGSKNDEEAKYTCQIVNSYLEFAASIQQSNCKNDEIASSRSRFDIITLNHTALQTWLSLPNISNKSAATRIAYLQRLKRWFRFRCIVDKTRMQLIQGTLFTLCCHLLTHLLTL